MIDKNLAICAALSVVVHFALERGLQRLPARAEPRPPERMTIAIIEPEPPKEPEKPPEPPPPEPPPPEPPKVMPPPTAKPAPVAPHVAHTATVAPIASTAPPAEHAVQTTGTEAPVYGVTMESTSQQGGPAVAVGNTLSPGVPAKPGPPAGAKPSAPAPIAAYEATKLPIPTGRCFGTYTEEATAAGLEGTVLLDLTVDETGRARDIAVVQGLAHGLSKAAVTALLGCRFTPGERDGKPVAVRIRGFKIEFVLPDSH